MILYCLNFIHIILLELTYMIHTYINKNNNSCFIFSTNISSIIILSVLFLRNFSICSLICYVTSSTSSTRFSYLFCNIYPIIRSPLHLRLCLGFVLLCCYPACSSMGQLMASCCCCFLLYHLFLFLAFLLM